MITEKEMRLLEEYRNGELDRLNYYIKTSRWPEDVQDELKAAEELREGGTDRSSSGYNDNYYYVERPRPQRERQRSHGGQELVEQARQSVEDYNNRRIEIMAKDYRAGKTKEKYLQLLVSRRQLTTSQFEEITGNPYAENKTPDVSAVTPRRETRRNPYSGHWEITTVDSKPELPKEKPSHLLVFRQPDYGQEHIKDISQLQAGKEYAVMKGREQVGNIRVKANDGHYEFTLHHTDLSKEKIDLAGRDTAQKYGLMPDTKGRWSTEFHLETI